MDSAGLALDKDVRQAKHEALAWEQANHMSAMTAAIQQHDREAARELHRAAGQALAASQLSPAVTEILRYKLLFYSLVIEWFPPSDAWHPESYKQAKQLFSEKAFTVPGNLERLTRLMYIRVNANKDGFEPLDHQTLNEFVDQLDGYPAPDAWFPISRWAFHNNDIKLLERAFEKHLIDPVKVMGHARWQRINMMYQLVAGKASRRDVAETIKTLAILPQVIEFYNEFLPRCEELGLMDDELRQELAERRAQIEAERPAPQVQRRTQRIRSN